MTPSLSIHGLSKRYDDIAVLSDIDLVLPAGGTLALLGRSGSGKSTLLKCLNLLEQPDAGDLQLNGQSYSTDGKALFEPWELRREIGLVMQDYALFPHMTINDNLRFALRANAPANSDPASNRVAELARALEIDTLLTRYPASLSGGQAQRCALARALVLRPKVLLLDEISSALDPETIQNAIAAIASIREIAGTARMSIILVTHHLSFATDFADEIAYLSEGRIIERHPSAHFVAKVTHPEAKRFIASHSGTVA